MKRRLIVSELKIITIIIDIILHKTAKPVGQGGRGRTRSTPYDRPAAGGRGRGVENGMLNRDMQSKA